MYNNYNYEISLNIYESEPFEYEVKLSIITFAKINKHLIKFSQQL